MTGISDDHGWIHLHRKIQFNFLWTEPRTFSKAEAWIDMLMEARHSERPAQILIGSHLIECGRGQCIKSLESWGSRWHWDKSKVRRFFALLQDANQIRLENVTKTTRITICNYETYNGTRPDSETIMKRSCYDDETHLTPNKNVIKKEREKEPSCGDAAKETKPRNLLMDALGACDGDIEELSKPAWGRVAKALSEIKSVMPDVTPDEIKARAKNYRIHFEGAALTSTALAKHWAKCKTAPKTAQEQKQSEFGVTFYE
jgi:hypothetical protein